MKRSVAVAIGLAAAAVVASAPPAQAAGGAACTISGTISFSPSAGPSSEGRWTISPGAIDCRGTYNGWERILGRGSFAGEGSYTSVVSGTSMVAGDDHCVHGLGSGVVDYWIPTSEQDLHVTEPHSFTLAAAGTFTTPTLRGTFQIPVHEGNCSTTSATRALFLAEVTLVRLPPPTRRRVV